MHIPVQVPFIEKGYTKLYLHTAEVMDHSPTPFLPDLQMADDVA